MIAGALADGLVGALLMGKWRQCNYTASTTAGTVVASNVFSSTLLELGVSGLAGAAMIHAGATVFDHMPHGSFFHATGGSVHMNISERLILIPYESALGFVMTVVSTIIFGVFAG